jgi:hypothetical protein
MTAPNMIADGFAAYRETPSRQTDMWRIRPATVPSGGSASLMIKFDEESFEGAPGVSVPAVLLTGTAAIDDRVMVQSVPPYLNFVVSNLSAGPGPSCENYYSTIDAQAYNDNVYHDILVGGVAASIVFPKYFTASRFHVAFTLTGFVTASLTGMRGGVTIAGVDYDMSQLFYNASVVNTHLQQAASREIPADLPAGNYVITMRVRRFTGAGNVQFDTGDLLTCTVTEST